MTEKILIFATSLVAPPDGGLVASPDVLTDILRVHSYYFALKKDHDDTLTYSCFSISLQVLTENASLLLNSEKVRNIVMN